jgi:hypothetical protein
MTMADPDIRTFLKYSSGHMDINGLGQDWENGFVQSVQRLRSEPIKQSFRRGFAKSVLGQLTPKEYERATGWDFDTDDEFRAHLKKYWQLFYGRDDPAASV